MPWKELQVLLRDFSLKDLKPWSQEFTQFALSYTDKAAS